MRKVFIIHVISMTRRRVMSFTITSHSEEAALLQARQDFLKKTRHYAENAVVTFSQAIDYSKDYE